MTRVDRYILAEFARVFCVCFMTFLGLFIVADLVNNLDDLVQHSDRQVSLGRVLLSYYGPKVPWFFDLIGRVVAFIAAVFAITSLQRNNEMAALMAAGVSRWRIVKPLVVGVAVIAVLGTVNRELVIPRLSSSITRSAKNFGGNQLEEVKSQHDHATGVFFDGTGIVRTTKTIEHPRLGIPWELAPRGTRIEGQTASYAPATSSRPSGFLVREVAEGELSVKQTLMRGDDVVVYHPSDTPWLQEDELFVVSGLPFDQLSISHHWRQYASTWSLIASARNQSLDPGADVSVTIHKRLLQPCMDVLVFFLGIPVVLSRESRNAFIAVGSCMLMVCAFVLVSLGLQSMGMTYVIRPSLAAWAPLMIFVPLAVLMSEPLRR